MHSSLDEHLYEINYINNTLTANSLLSSSLKNYPVCQQHFAEVCIVVRTGRLLRYSLPMRVANIFHVEGYGGSTLQKSGYDRAFL
jgi:hypothetical protein